MRNRMYGGVRGRKTKVGRKLLRFPPTRFIVSITLPTVEMMDRTTEMTQAYLVTTLMMHLGSRPASLAYLT